MTTEKSHTELNQTCRGTPTLEFCALYPYWNEFDATSKVQSSKKNLNFWPPTAPTDVETCFPLIVMLRNINPPRGILEAMLQVKFMRAVCAFGMKIELLPS